MKENFVIREERHPVAMGIASVADILTYFGFMWGFTAFFVLREPVVAGGAVVAGLFWLGVSLIVVGSNKESYYCAFEVEGLKLTYAWEQNKEPKLTINNETINYIMGKCPEGEVNPYKNNAMMIYAKEPISGSHVLKFFHSTYIKSSTSYIMIDDVVVVEQGIVHIDRIREILSNDVTPTNPAPRPIDTGVMPPFQTTPSHNRAERTIAPRTKRYAIVGEKGVFANHQFNITDMLVLGRDEAECSVAFPSDTVGVSRVHCKLVVEAEGLCVYDLGSTYGTVVNNNKTISANQRMKLNHGDTITIGSSQTFVVKSM